MTSKKKTKKTVNEKIGEALSISTPPTPTPSIPTTIAPTTIVPAATPVEGEVIEAAIVVHEEQSLGFPVAGENPDINADYEAIRKQMAEVSEQAADALDKIKEVADQGDAPRAYEVVGQLAKITIEVAEARIKLHKDMKALRDQDLKNAQQRAAHIGDVNNSVFVGTTEELLKLNKAGKLPTQGDPK